MFKPLWLYLLAGLRGFRNTGVTGLQHSLYGGETQEAVRKVSARWLGSGEPLGPSQSHLEVTPHTLLHSPKGTNKNEELDLILI